MSIAENLIYTRAHHFSRYGFLRQKKIEDYLNDIFAKYQITPFSSNMQFRCLSGGNQQKAILGQELSRKPNTIIALSPMTGLDEEARVNFLSYLRWAKFSGVPVVYGSGNLQECARISKAVLKADSVRGLVPISANDDG